jgi:zona occludens toxin
MITLITGAPGAGKTAALVAMLEDFIKAGRPLYVDGIPELVYEHTDFNVDTWMDDVPDGSIVVVDEVQRRWRPAGAAAKVPPAIAGLETHRHRGLDFYIITQEPRLVHSNVRALVGRHVHLRDVGFLGRWWYEWPETCSQPGERYKSAPLRKKYSLPKKIFGKYKSASEHIKPVRSFPKVVLVLLACALILPFGAWQVYKQVDSKLHPPSPEIGVQKTTSAAVVSSGLPSNYSNPSNNPVLAFLPRLENEPGSAPAYDSIRKVVVFPRIVGGYCQGTVCTCYLNGGARARITVDACREWVSDPPFDPFHVPADVKPSSSSTSSASSSTPVQALTSSL